MASIPISPAQQQKHKRPHSSDHKKNKKHKKNANGNGFANAPSRAAVGFTNGHVNGLPRGVDPRIEAVRQRLPIYSAKDAIVEKIKSHETVILLADTGSGKSTRELVGGKFPREMSVF